MNIPFPTFRTAALCLFTAVGTLTGPSAAFAATDFAIKNVQAAPALPVVTDGEAGRHPSFGIDVEFETSDGGLYTMNNTHTPQELSIQFPVGMKIDTTSLNGRTACDVFRLTHYSCPDSSRIGTLTVEGRSFWASPVPWPIWGWRPRTWTGGVYRMSPGGADGAITFGYSVPGYFAAGGSATSLFVSSPAKHRFQMVMNFSDKYYGGDKDISGPAIVDRLRFSFDGLRDGLPPVMTLPTRCDQSLDVRVDASSFSGIDDRKVANTGFTPNQCNSVKLDPKAKNEGDGKSFEQANGLLDSYKVQTTLPKDDERSRSATAAVQLVLPQGSRLGGAIWTNSSCSEKEFALNDQDRLPACPFSSRLGSAKLQIGELNRQATGELYLGEVERISDQALGYRGKVFFAVESPWPIPFHYKMVGDLTVNWNTGQASILFGGRSETQGMIQLPWEMLELQFSRFVVTPEDCVNEAAGSMILTPWADSPIFSGGRDAETRFTLLPIKWDQTGADCPAVRPFRAKLLTAATSETKAKQAAGIIDLAVKKEDPRQDQPFKSTQIRFPLGMNLDLTKVKTCPETDVLANRCSTESELSTPFTDPTSHDLDRGKGQGIHWYGGGIPGSDDARLGRNGATAFGRIFATNITPTGVELVATLKPAEQAALKLSTQFVRGKLEHVGPAGQVIFTLQDIPQNFAGIPFLLRRYDLRFREGLIINPDRCDSSSFDFEGQSHSGATMTDGKNWQATGC